MMRPFCGRGGRKSNPMTGSVMNGKLTWDIAVRTGRVEVIGQRELRERLRSWFLLSPIAMTGDEASRTGLTMLPLADAAIAAR